MGSLVPFLPPELTVTATHWQRPISSRRQKRRDGVDVKSQSGLRQMTNALRKRLAPALEDAIGMMMML